MGSALMPMISVPRCALADGVPKHSSPCMVTYLLPSQPALVGCRMTTLLAVASALRAADRCGGSAKFHTTCIFETCVRMQLHSVGCQMSTVPAVAEASQAAVHRRTLKGNTQSARLDHASDCGLGEVVWTSAKISALMHHGMTLGLTAKCSRCSGSVTLQSHNYSR